MTTTWRVTVTDSEGTVLFTSTATADDDRAQADVESDVLDALTFGMDTTGWAATAEQPDTGPRI